MVTFEEKTKIVVKVDGRIVGEILQVKDGYQYKPKNSTSRGEVFKTKVECMHSLTH